MVRVSVLALALSACAPSPDAPVTPPAAAASTSSASSRPTSSATPVASIAPPPPGTADAWTAASPVVETPEPAAAVTADGRVDGDRLRRLHLDRLARDESPVVVLQGGTPRELGARLCEQVVPRRPSDTPVLLKPNVCGFQALRKVRAPEDDDGLRGRITDPEFTRGVIDCLKARGHQRITVAEGCAVDHAMFEKVMARSGYAAMAAEAGVPLVGLDDDGVFDAVGERPGKPLRVSGMEQSHVPQLLLPKILVEHLDHGLFLSLPKIKAHRFSVVSLGIKGTQGVVMRSDKAPAHQQKWRMHAELHRYLSAAKSGHEDRAAYVASLELFS
ncbi:MAG: DUF362 domain-containing protein, partial [Myxococcales bacterium]|nr:DUF362 domain-containing protein [Myxococcales bacterium]